MGYFQLADSPDRHEPGTGELNYTRVLQCGRAIVDEFHIPFTAQAGVTERPAQHHRTQTVGKNAPLTLKLGDGLHRPTINAVEIEQVFVNLLYNAIEAGGGAADITISTAAVGDTISLVVQDQGRGLSAADRL